MVNWLNFAILCYWSLFFGLLMGSHNFFSLILGAEAIWVILYFMSSLSSVIFNDIGLMSLTFFALGFAAAELAIGLMLTVLMKYSGLSLGITSKGSMLRSKNG